eukprot:sb/3468379/
MKGYREDSFPKSLAVGRSVWDSLKCPSKSKIKGIKKPDLEDFTEKVCRFLMERCYPLLDRLSNEVEEKAHGQLVKLQCELLGKRDKEITAVQSAAEEEIKTFSSVLKKSCDSALAPKRISTAITSATEDRTSNVIVHGLFETAITSATEDRTSNVIVHGLFDDPDESSKDLEHSVCGIFDYMGECVTSVYGMKRLGRYKEGTDRPSGLKKYERYKDLYISPDRSPEEREERRKLVAELKERKAAAPGKTFGIREGKVMEVEV